MRHIFGQSNKMGLAGWRLWFLVAVFGAVCMGFVARLLYLQVVDTEEYESKAVANNYKSAVVPASRGEIYDRNGKKLVTNAISYNIDINEEGNQLQVDMTLTAPNCPAADFIVEDVRQKLETIEDFRRVDVNLVFEPEWNKDMMSEEAKLELGF